MTTDKPEATTPTRAAKVEQPSEVESSDGIRLEDCPADNRVRLFFPGKPAADTRSRMKSSGFRWAPTIGAWQAYRNTNSLAVAHSFVGEQVTA